MALVTEFQLKQAIVRVAKRLDEKGILTSTDGNLSARLQDGGTLITPSGSCKGQLEAEKIVRLFRDGSARSGPTSGSRRTKWRGSKSCAHRCARARTPLSS